MSSDRNPVSSPFKEMVARLYAFFGRQQNAPWLVNSSHWIERNIMVRRRQKRCETDFVHSSHTNTDIESYLKTHFCGNPFTTLETTHQGLAYVCCPIWLPTPIGRLDSDPKELWTGRQRKNCASRSSTAPSAIAAACIVRRSPIAR